MDKNVFKVLLSYMGKYKILMGISIVLAGIASVVNLYAYVCVYEVAKVVLRSSGNYASLDYQLMKDLGLQAFFYIAMSFGLYGSSLLFSHLTAYHTVANIRIALLNHLGDLPLGYHLNNASGKTRKIIEKNTDSMETLIAHQIPDVVQSIVLPFAFITFMFIYDWRLSLICLFPIILGFVILAAMLKGTSEGLVKQYQKSAQDIANAATEYVRGVSVVKVFGQTARSFKRYKDAVKEYSDYVIGYALSMENSDSLYNAIINSVFFFLIPGGILLFNATQNMEKFILSFIFFAVMIPATVSILNRIMKSSSQLMVASSALSAIQEIFNAEPLANVDVPKKMENCDIQLEDVWFSYDNEVDVLKGINFTMKEGTVTALVGESGGGKSTIANLIARFWDVQKGSVKIGGVDVREMDYEYLMKHISVVFQNTNLLKTTIAKNVSLYKNDATREEILEALHLAQCDDILEKLPDGIDTMIGTKGTYLSGGEVQRIALARAILKDAPIILLDEATAFADAENENLIQKALNEVLRDKTVLMIAHRLTTIVNADEICVIEDGQILEKGTHDALLKQNGKYARMYREYENSISWKIGGHNA